MLHLNWVRLSVKAFLLSSIVVLTGCAAYYGPPVDQAKLEEGYREASQAIERARSMDAMKYSPETFREAETLLDETFERQKTAPSNSLLDEYDRAAKLARMAALDAGQDQLSERQTSEDLEQIHERTLEEYRQLQAVAEKQADTIARLRNQVEEHREFQTVAQRQSDTITALRDRIEELESRSSQVDPSSGRAVFTSFDTPVFFARGSATFQPEEQKKVDSILPILKEHEDRLIAVRGFTDTEPITEDNMFESNWELSAQRAINVLKYLVYAKGIEKSRIEAIGLAEHKPRFLDESPVAPSEQRRVEILLYPPESSIQVNTR